MRLSAVDVVAEHHLDRRQRHRLVVPHHADVELAAGDELLDDRVGLDAIVDEGHALLERVVVAHDRRLRDADRRVLVQRLDDQREAQIAGPLRRRRRAGRP